MWEADIVMLNTGGWWWAPHASGFRSAMEEVFKTLTKMSLSLPPRIVVFQLCGFKSYGCEGKTDPLNEADFYKAVDDEHRQYARDINEIIAKYPLIAYLNTTQLSAPRIDAHPSSFKTLKELNRNQPDCQHWGLPGVPDIWNMILFNYHI